MTSPNSLLEPFSGLLIRLGFAKMLLVHLENNGGRSEVLWVAVPQGLARGLDGLVNTGNLDADTR